MLTPKKVKHRKVARRALQKPKVSDALRICFGLVSFTGKHAVSPTPFSFSMFIN